MARLTIHIPDNLLAQIDGRGRNRSGVISRDLDRYYTAIGRAKSALGDRFTSEEIAIVLTTLAHLLTGRGEIQTGVIASIHAHVEDTIQTTGLQIDGAALVEKLRSLSFTETCALIDSAERRLNQKKK